MNRKKNPFKANFVTFVFIFWNIFLFSDIIGFAKGLEKYPLSKGTAIALLFLIIIAVLMFYSERFRKKVLKEGFELEDVRVLLYLVLLAGSCMFAVIVFFFPLLQKIE